jgi:hypothetical protein
VALVAAALGLPGTAQAAALASPASPGAAATPAWVTGALADQFTLGNTLPLANAPWWGTHNSYNSVAELGHTLSSLDPNQKVSIVDQLRLGARQLEVDVHWFPALATGRDAPVVCHALATHVGCSGEKTLGPVLDEIAGWLRRPANRRQVVFLYLEDHLDNQTGYETAGKLIASHLGSLVYRTPSPAACSPMPLGLTRDRILASGAQVLVVANSCGVGAPAAWRSEVFDWADDHLEAQPQHGFDAYPNCGPDFTRAQYDSTLIRYFEELGRVSTALKAGGWPITPTLTARMVRCGVDMISFDNLVPGDPRLPALVWSWAPGQPAGGRCAVERSDGRWVSRACGERHRVACLTRGGTWTVPAGSATAAAAPQLCGSPARVNAVPRTGYQGQLLQNAIRAARARSAWIGYVRVPAGWVARERAGSRPRRAPASGLG